MTNPTETDINKIIVAAVNARIEGAVASALTSDETFAAFVTAGLQRKVSTGSYSREEKPLITVMLQNAIEEATKAVVAEEIAAQKEHIRSEVRGALERSIGVLTDSLVDGFVANAAGRYPSISVEFKTRGE